MGHAIDPEYITLYVVSPWSDPVVRDLMAIALFTVCWVAFYLPIALAFSKPMKPSCVLVAVVLAVSFGVGCIRSSQITELRQAAFQLERDAIVEGVIEVKHRQPRGGRGGDEIISVGGVDFILDWFSDSIGYRRTLARGGVLRDGTYVRIYHIRGQIVRIDAPR